MDNKRDQELQNLLDMLRSRSDRMMILYKIGLSIQLQLQLIDLAADTERSLGGKRETLTLQHLEAFETCANALLLGNEEGAKEWSRIAKDAANRALRYEASEMDDDSCRLSQRRSRNR